MSLRTRHLACLFLLVSTLGASQARAARTRNGFYGDRISAILYRQAVDACSHMAQDTIANITADPETLLIPAPSRAAFRSIWAMRPPAAQSAAVYAETSFARIGR